MLPAPLRASTTDVVLDNTDGVEAGEVADVFDVACLKGLPMEVVDELDAVIAHMFGGELPSYMDVDCAEEEDAEFGEKFEALVLAARKEFLERDLFTLEEYEDILDTVPVVTTEVGQVITGKVATVGEELKGAYIDIGDKALAYLPENEVSCYKNIKAKMALEVGEERSFMIVDGGDAYGNYQIDGGCIVSLRRLELQVAWQRCLKLADSDSVVTATVEQVNPGGVTCVVEGLRGFLPTSHLYTPIPKEELLGKNLLVKFLEIDPDNARLVLSCKRALLDSGVSVADSGLPGEDGRGEEFKVGEVYTGTVQSVMVYGAFVDLGGMSGLLHISQLSNEHVASVEDVLRVGDAIKVLVMSYDMEKGRVQLSTRKLEQNPGDMINNPSAVFENAEKMALEYKKQINTAKTLSTGVAEDEEGDDTEDAPVAVVEKGVEEEEFDEAELANMSDEALGEVMGKYLGLEAIDIPGAEDTEAFKEFLMKYEQEAIAYAEKQADSSE